jgi:hypothetical protein
MHEQMFLNGAPTVGFGDADLSVRNPIVWKPLAGFLVGSIGGALLGSLVNKGVGTAVGTIGGGLGGAMAGGALAREDIRATLAVGREQSKWRSVLPGDRVEKGQRIAITVQNPSPSDIADLNGDLIRAGNQSSTLNVEAWPPGYLPPPDKWPAGDTAGDTAYRFAFNAVEASTARDLTGMPRNATSQIWVRSA